MKLIYLSIVFMFVVPGNAQEELNDYKYLIVPKKFDSFRQENQYQTSTLVKYLFTQEGFNVVYDDALPADLTNERCLGLTVHLLDSSTKFTTSCAISLKDCSSKEVFTGNIGTSKRKEFKAAYNEAIQESFDAFRGLNYRYTAKTKSKSESNEVVVVSFKNDVKSLENPKDSTRHGSKTPMVEQKATPEEQLYRSHEPVSSDIKKGSIDESTNKISALQAMPLPNGYQLRDASNKEQMQIYKTSMPDFYLAKAATGNGLVYKKDGKWFHEYYLNDELIVTPIKIKF